MTFKRWLLANHRQADTPIGDLARDAAQDKHFPRSEDFFDYVQYLERSIHALEALEEAWSLYRPEAFRQTAYHESGHVVAALALGVLSEEDSVRVGIDNDYERCRDTTAENIIIILLAGGIAERLYSPSCPSIRRRCSTDDEMLQELLRRNPGLSREELEARTEKILRRWWPQVEAIAGELARYGFLLGSEILAVVAGR